MNEFGYDKILSDIIAGNGQAAEEGRRLKGLYSSNQKEALLKQLIQRLLEDEISPETIQSHKPLLEFVAAFSNRDDDIESLPVYRGLMDYAERVSRARQKHLQAHRSDLVWAPAHQQLIGLAISRY